MRRFPTVLRLVLPAAVLGLWALPGFAKSRTLLHPVDLEGYRGSSLKVAVELPCGATFLGLVAKESGDRRTLKLAALIEQPQVACAGLEPRTTFAAPYLDLSRYANVAAMAVNPLKNRAELVPLSGLTWRPGQTSGGGDGSLEAAHVPRCGEPTGVLIRSAAASGGPLEVALVERRTSRGTPSCRLAARLTQIRLLKPTAAQGARAYRPGDAQSTTATTTKTPSLQRRYELLLAPVDDALLGRRRASTRGLTVRYQRACNEAPVGIVLSGGAALGDSPVGVGVLVARYPNLRCEQPPVWSHLSNHDLQLPRGLVTYGLPASGVDGDLLLSAANRFRKLPPHRSAATPSRKRPASGGGATKASPQKIHAFNYLKACEAPLGTVYAHDPKGHLAVGALLTAAPMASSCKKPPSEVSLTQPFIANDVRLADLVPLRLTGQL